MKSEGDLNKNELSNTILLLFTIMLIFTISASIYRSVSIGWQPIMAVHIAILLISIVLSFFRNSIRFEIKIFYIIFIFSISAIGGLLSFGLIGGNSMMWISIPIIITAFFSLRIGVIVTIVNTCILIITGMIVNSGNITFNFDSNTYQYSIQSWLFYAIAYPFMTVTSAVIVGILSNHIKKNLLIVESQKKELEIANATKDKLFSVIAHDLRAPFTGLMALLYVFCNPKRAYTDEERIEMLKELMTASQSTHSLLENLLTWSTNQIEGVKITKNMINAKLLVNNCIPNYIKVAKEKNITINNNLSDDLDIYVDESSICIVLSNLIYNAIKFTPDGGFINFSGHYNDNESEISISDSGIGMTKTDMKRLFDNTFFRATFGTNNEKGTGLGLKLCHDLMLKNDAVISVKSIEGEGSTFTLSFPCNQDAENF